MPTEPWVKMVIKELLVAKRCCLKVYSGAKECIPDFCPSFVRPDECSKKTRHKEMQVGWFPGTTGDKICGNFPMSRGTQRGSDPPWSIERWPCAVELLESFPLAEIQPGTLFP